MIQYQIPWTEDFYYWDFRSEGFVSVWLLKRNCHLGFSCVLHRAWTNHEETKNYETRFSIWKVSLPKIKWKDTTKHEYRQHTLRVFVCVTNDYHISDITFLRGRGESSGVHPEATSSPLTSTSTRLETSGGWDIMRSI